MIRTVSLIVLSVLFVPAAQADEIRHPTFPNVLLGTWAETAEQCVAKDKSNVVIEPAKYGESLPEKTQIVNIVVRPLGQDRAEMG